MRSVFRIEHDEYQGHVGDEESQHGQKKAYEDFDYTKPTAFLIGNEGNGVSALVKKNCDFIASIPMKGDIDSLNASVAAGVLAYEIVRQRL